MVKCVQEPREKNKYGEYVFYYSPLNKNGTNITSVWDDIYYLTPSSKERKTVGYDTQKPKALVERIIKASSNEGDLVADFFMGSCTTGEVALELDRKFIGCDIGDKACEISKNRVREYKNNIHTT